MPSMGAVLHTLNIRLTAEQLGYIANHADDNIVIVDMSLAPLLARSLPAISSVHTVIAVGEGDPEPLRAAGKAVVSYEDLISTHPTEFDWPELDETSASAMCYTSGTTGNPKGVVYSHRSTYLHSLAVCTGNGLGIAEADRILAIVPMFQANAWGLIYAALMAGPNWYSRTDGYNLERWWPSSRTPARPWPVRCPQSGMTSGTSWAASPVMTSRRCVWSRAADRRYRCH